MPTRSIRRLVLSLGLLAASPALAQDVDLSEMVVRMNRLENVSRQMSGQIETLQYENRQLKEQLRKFQEDVEFRLQEGKGGGGGRAPAAARPAPASPGAVDGGNPGSGKPGKRGDAFDPSQSPGAPGAPRQLGSTGPSAPLASTTPQPQGEMRVVGRVPQPDQPSDAEDDADTPAPGFGEPVDLAPPMGNAATTGAIPAPSSPSVAATGTGDSGADFESAYALIQGRQYEQAEMSLRQFIQSHPRDRNVPKATYWLGETYLQRNRSREAAEQFLKVSTDYASSPVAPEAMMKLGASLSALGAKAQACATLAEVERKFPSASNSVRQGVEREQRRARCTA